MHNTNHRYPLQIDYYGYGVEKIFCKGRCQEETGHFQGVSWENGKSEKRSTCVVCGYVEKIPISWEECLKIVPWISKK